MKAKDLIKTLKQYPDAEVFYEDMYYGGKDSKFNNYSVKYSDTYKCFLVESLYYDDLD